MKTLVLTTAIALMMSLNLAASADGTKSSSAPRAHIFQTNQESVDVFIAKDANDLVKIRIYSESGTLLMTTRVKKQNTRYIRFHLKELPSGTYNVSVEKDKQVLSNMEISK